MTKADFDGRIARVREEILAPHGADFLLSYADDVFHCGNVRYLTNFDVYAMYALAIVPRVGDVAVCFGMHHSAYLVRAKEVTVADYIRGAKDPAPLCRDLASDMGVTKPRFAVVGGSDMFSSIRTGLDNAFPEASFIDVEADFARMRLVKSATEVECLRRAATIAGRALDAARQEMHEKQSDQTIAREAAQAARRAGADVLHREMVGVRMAISNNEPAPAFTRPRGKYLTAGDLLAIEVCPQFEGYRGVVARTYTIGEATTERRDFMQTLAAVHRRACSSARAGMPANELADIISGLLQGAQLQPAPAIESHGVGLDAAEAPAIRTGSEAPIEAGCILALRTSAVAPDGGLSVIADTVVVGVDGSHVLSEYPYD